MTESANVGKRFGSGEHFQKRLQKNVVKHRAKSSPMVGLVPVLGFGEYYVSPEGLTENNVSSLARSSLATGKGRRIP